MSWFVAWFATLNIWKLIGLSGQLLFGSRFFVQWIASERARRSIIPLAFWYLSLIGGLLTLAYAIYIQEPVFIIAQLGGSIVYVRNLYFIHREGGTQRGLLSPDRS